MLSKSIKSEVLTAYILFQVPVIAENDDSFQSFRVSFPIGNSNSEGQMYGEAEFRNVSQCSFSLLCWTCGILFYFIFILTV